MYEKLPTPTNPIDERKARMWNAWARTSRLPGGDGVITHVFEEGGESSKQGKSICGVRTYAGGGLNMFYDDYTPGCFRCQAILRKMGLLPPKASK
jgi:hypothetical protein